MRYRLPAVVGACVATAVVVVVLMNAKQRYEAGGVTGGGDQGHYYHSRGLGGPGSRAQCLDHCRNRPHAPHNNDPRVLIAVFSAKENKLQRDTIRQTWMTQVPDGVLVRFFIGSGQISDSDMRTLRAESNKNKDIAFLPSVVEAYSSLSTKLIHTLQWINDLYPDVEFVTKTDDDSYVRADLILQELETLDFSDTKGLYWGYFDGRAPVQQHGKWEEHDWFLSDHYLPYALGGGYVISNSVVEFIVDNAHLLTRYKSEDVSMGVWTAALNIVRQHDKRFDTEWKSRGCHDDYLISHKQSTADMLAKYNMLLASDGKRMCNTEADLRPSYEYNWKAKPSQCCIPNQ